ncbi:MAG: M20/M25/M40 family metallo-hydrolase [Holophagaceae bacterium]|uniref:M20/M25/M40 family metallo-hydrolase n=1 Tax=Candidatus Geothrix skivensis TaxID=2954439 RepID=A0A9D7SG08_9BACT|nr:M20/M25/M40 family metallo-hydrolase [Candidatus Geothrix skivensis]
MPNPDPTTPVITLCREFVRIPSLSGQEGALAALVAERMRAMGLAVEIDRFGSVLGMRKGVRPGPTVLLDAHLDTVPVTEPTAWAHDPFGADIDQDRLWGRGAADTKGSLAAMLCAVADLEDFPGTLILSASVCEENLTSAALNHVLDRHPVDLVLVGEPTSLQLGVGQKGRAGLLVEARGRSAHTSRPELGDNAIYKLVEALARIRTLPQPEDPALGRGVCELIEIASEPRPSPGMVPHRCTGRLALRLLPGETAPSVLARLAPCLEGLEGVTIRLAEATQRCYTGQELTMPDCVPAWKNPDLSLQARLLEALGTAPFAAPYTTNASAAAARGLPAFLLGPGSIEQAHGVDEWIALDQLNAAPAAYAAVLRAFHQA